MELPNGLDASTSEELQAAIETFLEEHTTSRTPISMDSGIIVAARYSLRPRNGKKAFPNGPYCWCANCQKSNHWSGFLVDDDDGVRRSLGSDCCTGPLKQRLKSAVATFDKQRDNANRRARLGVMRQALAHEQIQNALSGSRRATLRQSFDEIREILKADYGTISRELRQNAGHLTISVDRRNETGFGPQYISEKTRVATLSGSLVFGWPFDPCKLIDQIHHAIEQITNSEADALDDNEVLALIRIGDRTLRDCLEILDRSIGRSLNLSADECVGLNKWLPQHTRLKNTPRFYGDDGNRISVGQRNVEWPMYSQTFTEMIGLARRVSAALREL